MSRQSGISDEEYLDEIKAQRMLYPALDACRDVLVAVERLAPGTLSGIVHAFDNFVHDDCPRIRNWDELLAEKRLG